MAAEVAFDRIEGLSELIRDLRKAPERLDKQIRAGFREVAKGVREEARDAAALVRPRSSPAGGRASRQHWDALVKSITSGADAESPWVRVGSNAVPWAMSFEYGSRRYREFPWRGNSTGAGYFLWPSVRANEGEIKAAMLAAVDEALGLTGAAS